ncbi:MAG TPA: hypothetical protein VN643_04155 [Pyrinomonadaceae bacterium]|nr:hypothetical protein [Pyrinomonadaceae bacterium]
MNGQVGRTLLSLAGLGVFLVLAFGSEYSSNKNSNVKTTGSNSSVTTSTNTQTYTNVKSRFSGKLASNYVGFTFDYPSSWKRDDKAGTGDSPNFVKVEHNTDEEITLENFAVGYFTGQKQLMPQLAAQLSDQFKSNFPEYQKVSEGETKVGEYEGYEFRFTSHTTTGANKPIEIWGRAILLAGDTDRKGAALVMLATSASPDVHGVEEVGEKGDLPGVLSSFKFKE